MKLNADMQFAPRVRVLLWSGVIVQFLLWLLQGPMCSQTESWHAFLYGSITYWSVAVLVVLRRPCSLTRWDVYFLRYGLIIITLTCLNVVPAVWHWKIGL